MKEKVSILLVGIGGYGNTYVEELLEAGEDNNAYIKGVVDVYPESCPNLQSLLARNIPVYHSMDDFYSKDTADLAVISTPIHFHCEQTCLALSHGSNVLCEKPLCSTIQEASKMIEARDKSGKFVAIGYQWSFSDSIHALKNDILGGLLGKARRFKTIVLWPRNIDYYKRDWAGKIKDESGRWVLDSVANNATAHYLHNMFYVLGDKTDKSAKPHFVTAELYRANSIENFDTSVIRIITENNVEMFFYASHAVKEKMDVTFEYEFEMAKVLFGNTKDQNNENITAFFKDGTRKDYGNPYSGNNKLHKCIDAVSRGASIPCGIEAAYSQTLCINGAQESMPDIIDFPKNSVRFDESFGHFWVDGLDDILKNCYETWSTPIQMSIAWSRQSREINVRNYSNFEIV
jgi:Predicted dehydrogenases and related proteins